ncbi:ACP S-malonyltransferase [Campylobacter sp. FMV-PI01]|uniref:Malonyl CoA-acyl carrier protein transacylase n=1 Tax=Campylobacter portucalensis TaxID=2608384 RepID=A0A6L5WK81_9BACT|nr:ACP S-malonyltransferase [Campylobacter portucalensis]MSN96647.1 ACP S-malonyltransferase [Campylobacter portucalensis]
MKFAFIFPGQGSQKIGMGKEIYENFVQARELLDAASDICKINFKKLLFLENDDLNLTQFTQPAIVLNSFMSYLAIKDNLNLKPKFSLGHSLGEFSALGVSGAFSLIDTIKLVNIRGEFMQKSCENKNMSMMVVLGLMDNEVEDICENSRKNGANVWAANYNCDGQIVVAGDLNSLTNLEKVFKEFGARRAMLLNMSVASHCPILEDASNALVEEIKPILNSDFGSVISNVTALAYSTKNEALKLLKEQLIKPVLYKQSIKSIDEDIDFYVEFGSNILQGLNKKITKKQTFSVYDLKSLNEFIEFVKENI